MRYVILNSETRQAVDRCGTLVEANRLVGALNRAAGSSCLFGWVRI